MVSKSSRASDKRSHKTLAAGKSAVAAPSGTTSNGSSLSNGETLRTLYASLLRGRMLQQQVARIMALQARYDFVPGHEAVAVGGAAALVPGDTIAASRRDLVALVAAGASPRELLKESDICSCSARFMALSALSEDPFNFGTGIALAHKLAKKQQVVIAFGCEDAPSPRTEALKFAGSQKLPIVYVLKNGAGAETAYAPDLKPVSLLTRDGGFPGVIVDGQDVVAVWRVAQESIHRARNGAGPTLIDCRMEAARDPLAHMEHYLRKRSLWDEAWRAEVAARISEELNASLRAAVGD